MAMKSRIGDPGGIEEVSGPTFKSDGKLWWEPRNPTQTHWRSATLVATGARPKSGRLPFWCRTFSRTWLICEKEN